MKILKLHEHKTNPGGIVSLQNDLKSFYTQSNNRYFYFRTGKIVNHPVLSNPLVRFIDLAFSYLLYPFYLLYLRPDVIEINSSLVKKSFYRDRVYLKLTKIFSRKSKTILFNHGWNDDFKNQLCGQNNSVLKDFYNAFDKIILLANYFKLELGEIGVDTSKIRIITTGINYKDFENLNVKKKFSNRLLFLSRVEPEKGIYQFLEAIPTLLKFNKDFIFDIAGDGEALESVKNHEISKNFKDHIVFHGYVLGKEKIDLFKNAAIYIFPSYHGEGCPVSVLEAMAAGLPVIYTEVGALKELLKDGENGILIPPQDSKSLIEAVIQLHNGPDLRIKMGNTNKEIAEKEFDLKKIFTELEQIYKL
ncbi:glycosyltransferase family 4 protein [Shivajiella indica]|uniref:Glycosyltransferase family 4 protein n=1 Tax=Shivajiella indica TaxID=872115 RepID=A0ABW5BEI6_9BACT